jgi:hypothetical protein
VAKRKVDSDTLKKLQSELQVLRNYMTTAENGWDLLNSDVMGKYPNPKTKQVSVTLNDA